MWTEEKQGGISYKKLPFPKSKIKLFFSKSTDVTKTASASSVSQGPQQQVVTAASAGSSLSGTSATNPFAVVTQKCQQQLLTKPRVITTPSQQQPQCQIPARPGVVIQMITRPPGEAYHNSSSTSSQPQAICQQHQQLSATRRSNMHQQQHQQSSASSVVAEQEKTDPVAVKIEVDFHDSQKCDSNLQQHGGYHHQQQEVEQQQNSGQEIYDQDNISVPSPVRTASRGSDDVNSDDNNVESDHFHSLEDDHLKDGQQSNDNLGSNLNQSSPVSDPKQPRNRQTPLDDQCCWCLPLLGIKHIFVAKFQYQNQQEKTDYLTDALSKGKSLCMTCFHQISEANFLAKDLLEKIRQRVDQTVGVDTQRFRRKRKVPDKDFGYEAFVSKRRLKMPAAKTNKCMTSAKRKKNQSK